MNIGIYRGDKMREKYEYIISDFAMEISLDKMWRKKIFNLRPNEKLEIGYKDEKTLPNYIKDYIVKYQLNFYVDIVDECDEEFDEELIIFRFVSAEFPEIASYSGNNPNK